MSYSVCLIKTSTKCDDERWSFIDKAEKSPINLLVFFYN